eukprot:c25448_g1_i1.p1 GENE.c25448_g1_i1~~c25448_g1_i1.p1  ORF type:complete len:450 (+),score=76.03 c25448_g1_i1:1-1350(+)
MGTLTAFMEEPILRTSYSRQRVSPKQTTPQHSWRFKVAIVISVLGALALCALAIIGIVSLSQKDSDNHDRDPVIPQQTDDTMLSPFTPVMVFPPKDSEDQEQIAASATSLSCSCPRVTHQIHEEVVLNHAGSACVGGCGGEAFVVHAYGELVRKISVFVEHGILWDAFTAIQIELTNGLTHVIGTNLAGRNVERQSFTFQIGESIVGNILIGGNREWWRSSDGTGFLSFTTSLGRTFTVGRNRNDIFHFPANGRFLSGVFGRSRGIINTLGFVYVRPVRSTRLVNVQYPTLDFLGAPLGPTRLTRNTLVNDAPNELTQTIAFTRTVGTSNCWTATHTRMFGGSVTVRGSYLAVASAEAQFRWETSSVTTQTDCTQETRTESTSVAIVVPANHRCEVEISQMVNTVDRLPFTADLELTLNDGVTATIRTSGTYTTVAVAHETVERRCVRL